jgi:hypothetical protein
METQTTSNNWITEEQKNVGTTTFEQLPGLKMEENKITEVVIDLSKKFDTYTGMAEDGKPVMKAKIPVTVKGERMMWWLNKKNPTYHQILDLAVKVNGPTMTLKIIRTGQAKATKYSIVE